MKRLFLLFNGRFPGEKAASLFAAKSAEAFANQGLEVEILVPRRRGVDAQTAYEYFDVKRNFKIVELPIFDVFGVLPAKLAFWINYFNFSRACRAYLKRTATALDVVYSNEALPLYFASRVSAISNRLFYEMHDYPESKLWFFNKFLKKMRWVLVHNKWKAEKLKGVFENAFCEPNAVDINAFDIKTSTEEARRTLGLPEGKKIAVYTGHLYDWKGVDTLAEAAKTLSEEFLTVFVGGTDKDAVEFKKRYASSSNILVVGHRKHSEIPLWQRSADVLVLPNSGKQAISLYYTSPMKLFEYMASKKPIIASNIPSIREILDETNAVLVPPDDSKAIADAIKRVVADQKTVGELADKAFVDVASHTWDKRAERIIAVI